MRTLTADPLNIVICGIGGQGNVLASEIVAAAFNEEGFHVAVGETYGASQRGGSVMSHVRVCKDHDIGVLIPGNAAHFIVGFEPLETLRMVRLYGNKSTTVLYDPRPIYPQAVLLGTGEYPNMQGLMDEINATCAGSILVSAADIALSCGDGKAANIAIVGAFAGLADAPIGKDELLETLKMRFQGKVLELNQVVFEKGYEAARAGGIDPASVEKPKTKEKAPTEKACKVRLRFIHPLSREVLEEEAMSDILVADLQELLYKHDFMLPQKAGYGFIAGGHLMQGTDRLSDYLPDVSDNSEAADESDMELELEIFDVPKILV